MSASRRSEAVDGFVLDYTIDGPADAPAAVLLHGWPGDARDYREVVRRLGDVRTVVPDLRGFGRSERHLRDPHTHYSAQAQARSIAGLIEQLHLERPVLAGYDVGSRVCQQLVHDRPDLVGALAISPPLPGPGSRVLEPDPVTEFWYQPFHRLPLSVDLLDGNQEQVLTYLRHFWSHWSAPDFTPDEAHLVALAEDYARRGAFEASINWYRAGAGTLKSATSEQPPEPNARIHVPTIVLWPEFDPLFPRAWSDRLDEWFSDIDVRYADGAGHFTPLESPDAFADMVRDAVRRR